MWIPDFRKNKEACYHYVQDIYAEETLCGETTHGATYFIEKVSSALKCRECCKLLLIARDSAYL